MQAARKVSAAKARARKGSRKGLIVGFGQKSVQLVG